MWFGTSRNGRGGSPGGKRVCIMLGRICVLDLYWPALYKLCTYLLASKADVKH